MTDYLQSLPDRKRKNILDKYGLDHYDEYMLLKRSGARLPIDNIEFIDPIFNSDKNVTRIFYMAGVRHYLNYDGIDCTRAIHVTRGDEVFLRKEPDNRYNPYAVLLLDVSGNVLGYIPRYYSKEITELLKQKQKITCNIYNIDKTKNCNECIKVIMKIVNCRHSLTQP